MATKNNSAPKSLAGGAGLVEVTAVEPIRVDGTDVPPGVSFATSAAIAQALLADGAAIPADTE